ncbi:MAG: hypothetical protein ACXVAM_19210 [Vulcanimicrobiaceae bacterium]
MQYHDGSTVILGDIVNVPVPAGTAKARVVMLGETYEHLDIEPNFVAWVKRDKLLQPSSIVVEWVDSNPLAHDDPRYAPAGNYMFSPRDQWVTRDV